MNFLPSFTSTVCPFQELTAESNRHQLTAFRFRHAHQPPLHEPASAGGILFVLEVWREGHCCCILLAYGVLGPIPTASRLCRQHTRLRPARRRAGQSRAGGLCECLGRSEKRRAFLFDHFACCDVGAVFHGALFVLLLPLKGLLQRNFK